MARIQAPIQVKNGTANAEIGIYSFGAKMPKQPKAQFEFDVSAFRDPQGQKQFQGLLGLDPPVVQWISDDPKVKAVVDMVKLVVFDLTHPYFDSAGKTTPRSKWVSIAFKDHHGLWIAPAVAEYVAASLDQTFDVMVMHYGILERKK